MRSTVGFIFFCCKSFDPLFDFVYFFRLMQVLFFMYHLSFLVIGSAIIQCIDIKGEKNQSIKLCENQLISKR